MELPVPVVVPALLLCVAGSAFFALAETALFSLGLWRARVLAEKDRTRGPVLVRLLSQPDDLLATIVLGNTFANSLIVALGILLAFGRGWSWWVVTAVLFVLLVLACEVTPKALAVRSPDRWALRLALPMDLIQRTTRWIQRFSHRSIEIVLGRLVPKSIVPATSNADEENSDLVELAAQQGTLGLREKELILQILSLDRRNARDVMKPRAQMVALPDDLPLEEMVRAARLARHHRIPLYDETPDTIVGVLNARTLLMDPGVDLAEAIEFPSFVPASMNLLQLFEALQRQQRGLAIVLDEFGGTAGLVTLQDILEAVIGRIRGEGETEGFVMERLAEGRWRVSGSMRLDDFRREYPALPDDPDVDTVGGLVVKLAEVVPTVGEVFVHRGLKFSVRAADERRVREVEIERADLRGGRG